MIVAMYLLGAYWILAVMVILIYKTIDLWYWILRKFKYKKRYSTVKPSSSVSLFADHTHGVEPLFEYHFKRRGRIKPEIYTNRELSNISKAEAEWIDKQMKEVKKEKLIDTFDEAEIIEETKDQQTKLE